MNYAYLYTLTDDKGTETIEGFRNMVNTVWNGQLKDAQGNSPTLQQLTDPASFPMELFRGDEKVILTTK
jgi:hypothetical protein